MPAPHSAKPTTGEQRLRTVNLVRRAHQLLDRFLKMDAQDSQRAWEKLIELQALMDELRSLRPPHTFHRQK
jgi:hypothetical protein